jgi:hypothetical protein
MNRIKSIVYSIPTALVGVVATVATAFAAYDNASTTAAIAANVDTVGTNFITNASAALTAVLPYAIGMLCIFLAVHLAMRWMRGAAR